MREKMKEVFISTYRESKVLRLSVIIFFIESILYFMSRNILGYDLFVDIYIGIIGISLILIMNIKGIDRNGEYLQYFIWGHLYIAFFLWIHIGGPTNILREGKNEIEQILISLKLHNIYAVNIYKLIIIILSIYFYKNRVKFGIMNFMYFIISTFFYVAVDVILNDYNINLDNKYILIYVLIYIGLFIFTIYYINKTNKSLNIRITKKLIVYSILILIANIWYVVTIKTIDINLTYFQCSARLFIHIYVFTNFEVEVKKTSIEQEYNKIQEEINSNKEFNTKLTKQESILEELKKKTSMSINKTLHILDNLPEGMLIFKNNVLIYSNNEGNKYFKTFENNQIGEMYIENILNQIISDKISKQDLEYGFKRKIYTKDNKHIEVELIHIKDDIKVVVVKNNDFIVRRLQIEEEYNLYLENEEVKEEFYSNISHELRTPINIISSALQLNEQVLTGDNFESLKRNNDIIKQNCNRLIRTINNFIDTNKITEGYLHLPKSRINIVSTIDNIVEVSSEYVSKKNCKLVFDPLQEEIDIYANTESINRIFFNIISNTLKYGEENEEIYISSISKGTKVEIRVVYKSVEISKERIKNMFKKFSKCENYLTRCAEGSGLGLFITKKLVECNGGTISFKHSNGKNVFEIIIPIDTNREEVNSNMFLNINEIRRQADIEFSDIYF